MRLRIFSPFSSTLLSNVKSAGSGKLWTTHSGYHDDQRFLISNDQTPLPAYITASLSSINSSRRTYRWTWPSVIFMCTYSAYPA
ncbi:hypothetical protein FNH22_23455 [Fulvivirga sp. M361]|uniref:hypothetical protein n=1 Tax=Fulvivirga sp. M361 TaxID=2594266 RepID=UPI00117BD29A|nr:hypothetical protein [Fulvivirga sp. M361]TRX51723.1 hypothetical protein FNH22_23455 [Fulvivirga sp. M361]